MSEQPEIVSEPQAPSLPWYKVWAKVYFSPMEGEYRNLLEDPKAKSDRAVLWVGVSIFITGMVPLLLYWLSGGRIVHDDLVDSGLSMMGEASLGFYLIAVFAAALIGAPLGMGLATSLINWLATKLGGEGELDKFAFLLGAILAPAYFVDSALEGLLGNNFIGLGLRFIFPLYEAFLLVIALKAAYTLSTGKAIGVVLLIAVLIVLMAGCLIGSTLFLQM